MEKKFSQISTDILLKNILNELNKDIFFGVPKELLFQPKADDAFKIKLFNQTLDTPVGVAAGPHTQLAQNIIMAWLCGARYIELKTVQTLDEILVSKPCIDMQDEGYNCEWSQELRIHEAFDEYLSAWIIIHILFDKYFAKFQQKFDIGTIFNMSVGYNLEGIKKENVEWFFTKMKDCKTEKLQKIELFQSVYPNIKNILIPDTISNNITLSTMHGCPAGEIEAIGKYLIETKKLNTFIKLNPTLLGKEEVRNILNQKLGFKTEVPDIAFEHDLKYDDAIKIVKNLKALAEKNNVFFGVKLTNTLESINNKDIFGKENEMMYMSGRSLHPLSIRVARKLQNEFNGNLFMSFSAGADCFNIADILACGLSPVTVCSDVLKPGGYGRLFQYIEQLKKSLNDCNAKSIDELVAFSDKKNNNTALNNLNKYAESVLNSPAYKKQGYKEPSIKTNRKLKIFDCIAAPCQSTCPSNQAIPQYMYHTANGEFDKAFEVILDTNPFPLTLGMVCDHVCQTKCTRINYDNPLHIREIKRFIAEQDVNLRISKQPANQIKVAIIGAGPTGLSCAYYLARAGFSVDVFESKSKAGGMVWHAIPKFRLSEESIDKDIQRIIDLGVNVHYNYKIDSKIFEQIKNQYSYIYIGVGAQAAKAFRLEGENAKGVLDPLKFLMNVKNDLKFEFGKNIAVIGAGNTAMDVARTANRLVGKDGKVTLVYRRSMSEMPANFEEIKALQDEGIEIKVLTAPLKIISKDNKVKALLCAKMQLSDKDESGRRKPVQIPDSEFEIEFDTIIPALGQDIEIDFIDNSLLKYNSSNYETLINNVFIGGDAVSSGGSAIQAVADGKKVAFEILSRASKQNTIQEISFPSSIKNINYKELQIKKFKREFGKHPAELSLTNRDNFNVIINSLDKQQATIEASRCLYCDETCNICTTVCPNLANYTITINPVCINLERIHLNSQKQVLIDYETLEIKQKYQIINISNWCNECGNCSTFCPTDSAPYKEKLKIHLSKNSFDENKNGFYIEYRINQNSNQKYIACLHILNEELHELIDCKNYYQYSNKNISAQISKDDFKIIKYELNNFTENISLQVAYQMKIIIENVANELFSND